MGKAVVGKVLSWGNPGDRIWVKVNGRCFQATAATEINSGVASITIDEQGQSWAWSATHPQVARTRTLEFMKVEPEPVVEAIGRIKVLFYVQTKAGYDWYIGGDRPRPVRIYTSAELPQESQLSNTSRNLSSWVAGFKFSDQVVNVYLDGVYTCTEPWAPLLQWQGFGSWTGTFQGSPQAANRVESSSTTYEFGYAINTHTVSLNYESSSPLVPGSGSYSSFITGATRLEGNADGAGPPPPSSERTNETYSVGTIGFAFNKDTDTKSGSFSLESRLTSDEVIGGSSPSYTSTTTRVSGSNTSAKIPTHVFYKDSQNKKLIDSEGYSNSSLHAVRTETGDTGSAASHTRSLTITPRITGNSTYLYRQEDYQYSWASDILATTSATENLKDTLFLVSTSTGEETVITYDPKKYQSLNPRLGAGLIGNYYYLVLPSAASGYYQQGLWEGKTQTKYRNSPNIYDNETPTKELRNVPVWRVRFDIESKSVQIEEDAMADRVFPLLSGAVVVAASFY